MTFDVSLLPGRAQELKIAARDAAYREMTRYGTGGDTTGTAAAAIWRAAEQFSAGVENIYNDFLDIPAPEDFADPCKRLATAMGYVATEGHSTDPITGRASLSGHNTNLSLIGSSGDLIGSWTGTAAYTYKVNYADKFEPTASSQYAALAVMVHAVNAEACVWQSMRQDLDNLSKRAIEHMKKAGNKGGADWAVALGIAAAVIAIPVTGGASAIAIPAVAAGLSVAATGIAAASQGGPPPDEFGLDAGSSDAVLESLRTALKKTKDHAIKGEREIVDAMNGAAGVLDGNKATFCLPRPSIADAPDHPVNDDDMVGVDV